MNSNITEKKVIVKSKFDLAATVAVPENKNEKMPAVVLIAGTGTADRDGNMPKFRMNIYKELSDFFAGLGFVTIRYDKRGVGESKGGFAETGFNDLIDDVVANVNYLEGLDFIDKDRIILCGHSEGSMLATIASTRHRFGGLILIAGAGTTLRTALYYQNRRVLQETKTMPGLKGWFLRKLINDKNYLKNVNKMFDKCSDTDKDVLRIMGQKMSAKWIREHNTLTDEKMIEVISNAGCPVLAVTGGKDIQANPEDIKKIAGLKLPHVTCSIVPEMDHMLRRSAGEVSMLNIKKQYASEFSQPIHESLLNDIKEWTVKTGINSI